MTQRTRFVKLHIEKSSEYGLIGDVFISIKHIEAMSHEAGYTAIETSGNRFLVKQSIDEVLTAIAEAEGACTECREQRAKLDTIAFHLGSKDGADVVGEAIEMIGRAKK